MQLRRRTQLYGTLIAFIFIGIPIAALFLSPLGVMGLLHMTYLAPFMVLAYFISPGAKKIIETPILHPHSFIQWSSIILLILLCATCVFVGQLITLAQYSTQAGLLKPQDFYSISYYHIAYSLANLGLFPWMFILLVAILFYRSSLISSQSTHFSQYLPSSRSFFLKLIRVALEICLRLGTLSLILFSIALAAIQLSLIAYPSFNVMMLPLTGTTIAFLLLFVADTKKSEKIFKLMDKRKTVPYKIFLLILVYLFAGIFIGSMVVFHYLLAENRASILKWHTLPLLTHLSFTQLATFFTFGWWILASPVLGSLLIRHSAGRSLRKLIILVFIFSAILFLSTAFLYPLFQYRALNPVLVYAVQLIGVISLLLLARRSSFHQCLWLGYLPLHPMKKLRTYPSKTLLHIACMLLVVFSTAGIAGLNALISLSVLPFLFWIICLIIVTWKKA